jgi:hypothetical protein
MWSKIQQSALENYYWCYTAATSAATRQYIYNNILYKPLLNICQTCLKSFHNHKIMTDDNVQESMIFVYQLLNKLNPDKLKGALQFIWISTRRNALNIIYKDLQTPVDTFELDDYKDSQSDDAINELIDNSYCADKAINNEQIRLDIINILNVKIHNERVVNKSSTIFLILFKEYLIDNNYDERGFQEYVMNKMNLNLSQYRGIASKVRISTLLLNKKY